VIGTISVPAATLVQGLVLGLNYGLLALGLVLVYRTSRVLNFAHGELGVVAAVLLAKLVNDYHISYWPALVLCLAVGAGVGGLSELALRRLFDRPPRCSRSCDPSISSGRTRCRSTRTSP